MPKVDVSSPKVYKWWSAPLVFRTLPAIAFIIIEAEVVAVVVFNCYLMTQLVTRAKPISGHHHLPIMTF